MTTSSRQITTVEELRAIIGTPRAINTLKTIHHIDEFAKEFIAHSPFCLIASFNQEENYLDVSPKGDAPGFALVKDTGTLILPERPGNKLAATFTNILTSALVSIIFLIPGKKETLRIRGTARILVNEALARHFAVHEKPPALLLEISVRDVYFHCAKCMLRSKLWQPDSWKETDHLPDLAQVLARYTKQEAQLATIDAAIANNYRHELY